jgi:hypothetical protein
MILAAALALAACTVGQGEGHFHGCLYFPECGCEKCDELVAGCTAGSENYTLDPGFFAAETLGGDMLLIRIQKSGNWMSESEGLIIMIPDYQEVSRKIDEGGPQPLYIPPQDQLETFPQSQRYEASYYFNDTCGGSTASFAYGTGTLLLHELYRPDSESEWIDGEFDITFEDTRLYEPGETPPSLHLMGDFRFKYARGAPAQYFP